VAIAQPDVVNCGGLMQAKKIAALAEAHYVPIAPHNPNGPLATAASMHLAASIPNFLILETIGSADDRAEQAAVAKPAIEFEDGCLKLPTGPGLGIEPVFEEIDKLEDQNDALQEANSELEEANEGLKDANEELRLTNDVLTDANEDLEANNEALQAATEELTLENEKLSERLADEDTTAEPSKQSICNLVRRLQENPNRKNKWLEDTARKLEHYAHHFAKTPRAIATLLQAATTARTVLLNNKNTAKTVAKINSHTTEEHEKNQQGNQRSG
jgi:hypothetical protein